MASKMNTAGKRCPGCKHPVKNHRYSAMVNGTYAAEPGTRCGCGCNRMRYSEGVMNRIGTKWVIPPGWTYVETYVETETFDTRGTAVSDPFDFRDGSR